MNMIQVSCLGMTGVFLGLFLRQSKSPYAELVSMASCILIILFSLSRIGYIMELLQKLESYLSVQKEYFRILLKVIGITYVADFSAAICRDAGYSAVAGQIEIFAKLTVLAVSAPVITALLELIREI